MASKNFLQALQFVFDREGGYVDDPLDPGGATNLGITLQVLTAWKHAAVSKDDVKNLTKEEASAIYRANYWNVVRGDDLPDGVDLMVFDCGVNMGNGRSVKFLQDAVAVTADGAIGPQTLAAVDGADVASLIDDLASKRLTFYQGLPTFEHFKHGWTTRVQEAEAAAKTLAGLA